MHSFRRALTVLPLLSAALSFAAPLQHFDAFLVSAPAQSLVVSPESLAARGLKVAHEEKRLGVPTFVWLDGVPAGTGAEQTARATLARFADAWRLDATDVGSLSVREVHQNERTGTIVRFSQRVGGVEVFRSQLDVLLSRQGVPVAVSGYPAPSRFVRQADRNFKVSAEEAASLAFRDLTGRKAPFRVVASDGEWVKLASTAELGGWRLSTPARARRVFYLLSDRLEPAFYVELDAGLQGSTDSALVSFVFSARDGAMLMHHELTADASYRVWADETSGLPHDSPFGTNWTPNPVGVPNGAHPPFIPPQLITIQNFPFSRNDPWLAPSATVTTGNNVDAYADLAAPDGYSPNSADLRPTSTSPGTFDFTADLARSPTANATQRSAAVTQLFFDVNFLHDWFYDSGFDEVAGNAQAFNFGRGGREGDFVRAEAQDVSGRSSASMSTPADGASPRMQLYLFDGTPQQRDGALDNEVVAHEWAHLLSNRLVGNASGLVNNQGRSLGEGWSDFVALLQTVREEDRNVPGNNNFQGVYPVGAFVATSGTNDGAYFGRRRMPYSTHPARNSLTLKHVANGTPLDTTAPVSSTANAAFNAEVHNAGEVWAVMLWECYASLLNAYPFAEAQNRMKSYLVASLKLTPVSPTMLEARDALLAVTASVDPSDFTRFVNAFARRGAGWAAVVADRNAADHVGVVESFDSGSVLRVTSVTLGDDVVGCDQDGVLDVNETGVLRVQLRNPGRTALGFQTMTVSASGATATVSFPNGNTTVVPGLAAGGTVTVSLPVRLDAVSGPAPRAGLTFTFNEPSLPTSSRTSTHDARVHFDEQVGSTTDDMESRLDTWILDGFTRNGGVVHAADPSVSSVLTLTSPWVQVNPTGNFVFAFKERHSFEWDGARFWDGAVLEYSTDGLTWRDPFTELNLNPGYSGALETQAGFALSGRSAFVNQNPGFPSFTSRSVDFGTALAGQRVRFRFVVGSDAAEGAYGMDVDDVVLTNAANAPFASLMVEPGGTCNRRPLAVTADVDAAEGTLANGVLTLTQVQLDGTSSRDLDGSPLTFSWTQLGGPAVTLTGANTATPSFTASVSADTRFTFQLVVNDGLENSAPARAEVLVTNVNRRPVAVATGPASLAERSAATVTLTGTASTDADGDALTFAWTQTAGPAVVLSDATSGTPGFPVPEVTADTTFTFRLVVRDGLETSVPATVSVLVTNLDRAPTVDAGPDRTSAGRVTVQLTAAGTDADGDAVTYAWTQVSGATATLTNAATATASVGTPDVKAPQDLVFQVTATANGATATDTVTVRVLADQAPTVNAGADFATPGRTLTQLGGFANDPESDPITWAWTQVSGPTVTLSGASTPTPSFTSPDVKTAEPLVFQASVTANGLTATDTVSVLVGADRPPVVSVVNTTSDARASVTLGAVAVDPEGDPVTWAWTQTSGPTVTLTGGDTATPAFTAPDVASGATDLVFRVVATANGLTGAADLTVRVRAVNRQPVIAGLNDVTENERVLLTLTASALDPDQDALSWTWTQTGGPVVTLSGATSEAIQFTTPEVPTDTRLTFSVAATDPNGASSTATVQVTVKNVNRAPTAVARSVGAASGERVVLDGAGSTDPDGDPLVVTWKQTGGPAVELENLGEKVATFTAPKVDAATELTFELSVDDGTTDATASTVVVVQPAAKGSGCGCTSGADALPFGLMALALWWRRRR